MQDNGKHQHTSFADARAQAAEYIGLAVSEIIQVGNKIFEIPNPSLLDDDQQARYDQLQLDIESWDRESDVLNDDKTVRVRGALKEPNRKDGKLVENYNIQLAKAILGDDFAEFKKAGGRSSDVYVIWWKMNETIRKRRATDSKSVAGDRPMEVVPASDQG